MMLSLIKKPLKECDEEFLFKFALLDNPKAYLANAADLLKDVPQAMLDTCMEDM